MAPWLEINKPPVAKIAGNVVVTLPTSTAELDGSRSSDDKGIVRVQVQAYLAQYHLGMDAPKHTI